MEGRADPIRQVVELWGASSGTAKAVAIAAVATLIVVLVSWYTQEPARDASIAASTDSTARSPDSREKKPPQKWALPIARPLQQGMERLAGELEDTLSEMGGIANARVVLNRPDPTLFSDETAHVTAAVCLWLDPNATPSAAAIQGTATYISRAVPDLTEKGVTIVDGNGRVLFMDGQVVQNNLRDPTTTAPARLASSGKPSPWWSRPLESRAGVTILSLVIAMVLVAIFMTLRRGGRLSAAAARSEKGETPPAAVQEASPLSGLDASAVIAALRFERPQVMAFALARMDEGKAAAVLRGMPEAVRKDVQERMAYMGDVSPVIASAAEEAIAESARSLGASREEVNEWDGF